MHMLRIRLVMWSIIGMWGPPTNILANMLQTLLLSVSPLVMWAIIGMSLPNILEPKLYRSALQ